MSKNDSKLMFEAYVLSKTSAKAAINEDAEGCQCGCCKGKRSGDHTDEDCECMNRAVPSMENEEGASHDETDMSNSEESKEVQIGRAILDALDMDDLHGVADLARELIGMHGQK